MDIDDVKSRLAAIKAAKGDPEVAHSLEDELYIAFIEHAAKSIKDQDTAYLAREVLKARKIKFDRWYA